ncbi:unnamed protein product, partial [Meganyctiphanes norvegica]
RFQHPWQDVKSNFLWVKYLEHCGRSKGQALAAPLKLWPEPFPFGRNLFRTGMKLEAIDPQHQSLFCVMTVAEAHGHRIRLHFDGSSDQHDYWVNADSPNNFPVGWCEKNGRQLEAPPGVAGFTWKLIIPSCNHNATSGKSFYIVSNITVIPPNPIFVCLSESATTMEMWVCVATVADTMENRVLIHFDGWDKAYDFWTEVTSPYIHPVGWCSENSLVLHPPNDYHNHESFTWHEYLQDKSVVFVIVKSFQASSRPKFASKMKTNMTLCTRIGNVRMLKMLKTQRYRF